MAQKELLPLLRLIILPIVLLISFSANGDNIVHGKVSENEMQERPYALRVFVSSSMPVSLLKSYAFEAKKYGATLVFKGLPKGSFKELSKLVLAMKGADSEEGKDMSSIQIDDEAFGKFKVTSVPTIVLSNESQCEAPETCAVVYDKVDGNLSLDAALEKFASSGDMKEVAAEIIKQVDSEIAK